ncbi:MAG TPA: arsinothricin resistance N-acetyltransferase ArsN1 family B [Ktedonobacterales bacterium]|nr:arsinothricin resistance N-acetyltransferase ArsN1 family B [Ktedonobacterales bacterium]
MSMIIRIARPHDTPAITAIYAPVVKDTGISFEMIPPTEDEIAQRLTKTLAQFPWLVADAGGVVVGYAYASKHRERAAYQWASDVSVYVHKDWRGKGIGVTLYTALFTILRAQGYFNVYAGITLPNPASVALHEAMGMIPVGIYRHVGYKAGAWHDVGWWQGTLQELANNPDPPRALQDIATLPTWDSWLLSGELIRPTAKIHP